MNTLSEIYESPEFKAFIIAEPFVQRPVPKQCVRPLLAQKTPLDFDVWKRVFTFLQIKDFYHASATCRQWRTISSDDNLLMTFDLQELFPSLKIIDGPVWEKHWDLKALGLDVSNAPKLDKQKAYFKLKKLYKPKRIEKCAGVTILTLPKGLSRANLPIVLMASVHSKF